MNYNPTEDELDDEETQPLATIQPDDEVFVEGGGLVSLEAMDNGSWASSHALGELDDDEELYDDDDEDGYYDDDDDEDYGDEFFGGDIVRYGVGDGFEEAYRLLCDMPKKPIIEGDTIPKHIDDIEW